MKLFLRIFMTLAITAFATQSQWSQNPIFQNPVCDARFAQFLVEQQVMESKSVVEPVKRIKILLRSADFLWAFDQPSAHSHFADAT